VPAAEPQRAGAGAFEIAGLRSHIDPERVRRLVSEITVANQPHKEFTVCAPYTGEAVGSIPLVREADVQLAVDRARAAQPLWASRSFRERGAIFLRFHDLLLKRQDEILDLIQMETGKARRYALEEVLDTAVVARYYARRAERFLRPRRRKGALPGLTKTWELHAPVGVVGFVAPWNYPLSLAITDAIPALLAGNSVVLRPDPQTSFTALWAVSLLREAGLPADVLTVATGEGAILGPMLIDRVDFVMFTGSSRTGKVVARQAAERLIGCSLELGGKNPMLVLEDADIEAAVDGAVRGCFAAAGQVCVSIERIYVHRKLFEPFVGRFAERTRELRTGAAMDYSADIGSLTTRRQIESIEAHVRDAVEKGATVVAGGTRLPQAGALFYAPTILTNVREDMKLYAEETFGPVVSVYPFETEEEAVERANATPYGLNAGVYTRDTARGARVAAKIRAGSVNVNDAYAAAWASVDAPIGGMKDSGISRRHGAEGILKFTEAQTVAVQRVMPLAPPRGMDTAAWARWMTRVLVILRRTFLG
jgi:acyl-CoA reductase-like NAD-dependent aldehyde dehydrogenase